MFIVKCMAKACVKFRTVQILVVVAISQMRIVKANVKKGILRTLFGQELTDPKSKTNVYNAQLCLI